jgi:hypothetical protein
MTRLQTAAGLLIIRPVPRRVHAMKRHHWLMPALAFLAGAGCDAGPASGNKKITGAEVRQKVGAAAEAVGQYVAQSKDEFVAELRKRLDQLDTKIGELRSKAAEAAADAKPAIEKQITELSKKRDEYAKKVEEVQSSAGDAWKELRAGMDKAWGDLSKGISDAWEKFKK